MGEPRAAARPRRRTPTPAGSSGPGASSPAVSTRRCGRSPSVGGTPYTVARGEGAYVWDVEGRRYVDLVQSYGAVLLGHAHPVGHRGRDPAAARWARPSARRPRARCSWPRGSWRRCPGCEQVRLVSSGTEAAMSAIRVARGFTGRDRVVKFDGCYHGHADMLLAGGGSGVATLGLPGLGRRARRGRGRHPRGALQRGARARRARGLRDRRAGRGQHGRSWLRRRASSTGCAAPATTAGALLVFDEVITGFRLGPAGPRARFGVTPDLWCFGKVIGGGLPVGAFGGRARGAGRAGPDGARLPGGHAVGEPARHRRRPGRARGGRGRRVRRSSSARAARLAAGLEDAIAGAGLAVSGPAWSDRSSGCSSRPAR